MTWKSCLMRNVGNLPPCTTIEVTPAEITGEKRREGQRKGRRERERERLDMRRVERTLEHFVTLRRRQRGHGGLF
jgi:hypothetical protein